MRFNADLREPPQIARGTLPRFVQPDEGADPLIYSNICVNQTTVTVGLSVTS